jgi:Tfp pilus assembly protein PilF
MTSKNLLVALILSFVGVSFVGNACSGQSDGAATNKNIRSAQLEEVINLLDGWRGDSSVLAEAKERLDALLRSSPKLAAAHREYARYYIMSGYVRGSSVASGALAAAERSLNEALRIDPNYAEAYVLAGHLYYLQNRFPDAKDALNKARKIGTTDPWLEYNAAMIYKAEGDLDEAARRFRRVIESRTNNRKAMGESFAGLVRIYERTGQLDRAEEAHRQLIAYEPQTAWLYGNFGAFLLCQKDDSNAAIIQFRIALQKMNYGVARSGLAAALYRKWAAEEAGRPKSAASPLVAEARGLVDGTPVDVVTSFCTEGPAVSAVLRVAK